MYAVICEPDDRPALWAVDRLRRRLGAVRLVPVDMIALSPEICITIGETPDEAVVRLPDGARFGPASCPCVLNRVRRPPQPAVRREDAVYAAEEMAAITLAFLAAFGDRCVNPPDPGAMSGREFGLYGWLHMAALAGLPAAPFALGEAPPRPLPPPASQILVIGDRALGAPPALAARSIDLARLAGLVLMSLFLDAKGQLVGATAMPDLSQAGEAGADALEALMRGRE